MACYSLLARSQQSLPDSARIRCPMPHETIRACGTIATTLRYVIFILTIFWHFYSINDSALHPARPAGLGPARDGGFHLRPAAAGWIAAAELLALACAASWLGQTIELRNKRRLTLGCCASGVASQSEDAVCLHAAGVGSQLCVVHLCGCRGGTRRRPAGFSAARIAIAPSAPPHQFFQGAE